MRRTVRPRQGSQASPGGLRRAPIALGRTLRPPSPFWRVVPHVRERSHQHADTRRVLGSTKVRMFETPRGPKKLHTALGEASLVDPGPLRRDSQNTVGHRHSLSSAGSQRVSAQPGIENLRLSRLERPTNRRTTVACASVRECPPSTGSDPVPPRLFVVELVRERARARVTRVVVLFRPVVRSAARATDAHVR
jgi:hypothetical protein